MTWPRSYGQALANSAPDAVPVGAALRRDGLRSSPKIPALMQILPGLLRSPSRRKAAPTARGVAMLSATHGKRTCSCPPN